MFSLPSELDVLNQLMPCGHPKRFLDNFMHEPQCLKCLAAELLRLLQEAHNMLAYDENHKDALIHQAKEQQTKIDRLRSAITAAVVTWDTTEVIRILERALELEFPDETS